MGRTACTEPQCLYKGALYLTLFNCVLQRYPVLKICTRGSYVTSSCSTEIWMKIVVANRIHLVLPVCPIVTLTISCYT